jgi:hypothetical protein
MELVDSRLSHRGRVSAAAASINGIQHKRLPDCGNDCEGISRTIRRRKKVVKAVRKAVKKGLSEVAVEKAVSQGIAKAVPKKPIGKAAATADELEAKTA